MRAPLSPCLFVLAALALTLLSPPAQARTRVSGPFYYRFDDATPPTTTTTTPPDASWIRVERIVEIPPSGGRSLWVTTVLPDAQALDPTLHLPRIYIAFDAYLEGTRLAGDHDPDAGGRAWHMIDLPAQHADRWLTLHVTSSFSKTGIRGPLYVGSRADHFRAIVVHDAARLATIVVLLVTSLGALLLAARRERRAFLGFATWALCVAIWTSFYTGVRDLLWPAPRGWVLGWGLSLAWVLPSFLVFFNANFQRGERWLTWLLRLAAVGALVASALLLLRAPPSLSNPYLALYRLLLGVTFFAVVYALLKRIREGNREAAVLAAGMAIYAMVGVRDLLVGLAVINAFELWSPWGMLVFLSAGAIVLQQRLVALRKRADRDAARVAVHAHERELMLRDMHDGLGRITTSISLLTEVARRDRGKDGPLDSISSLAHEGSEEIRIFMRGLDDDDRDWQSLESHLREHARQLVEALGGRYELHTSVARNAVQPSPYLYVHLLRVFQEGLTNALKYAQEPNVNVVLDVTRDGVALELRNDGVRMRDDHGATHGISLGAGLENMRGRVDDLGGVLDLDVNRDTATATLRLQIPLPLRYAGGYPDASAAPK